MRRFIPAVTFLKTAKDPSGTVQYDPEWRPTQEQLDAMKGKPLLDSDGRRVGEVVRAWVHDNEDGSAELKMDVSMDPLPEVLVSFSTKPSVNLWETEVRPDEPITVDAK